uniref:Uncharacterized protein n=1 Tax=Oryza punctata TaxID=4537 RepID=A0A0E0MBP0_ORYPU
MPLISATRRRATYSGVHLAGPRQLKLINLGSGRFCAVKIFSSGGYYDDDCTVGHQLELLLPVQRKEVGRSQI